MDWETVEHLLRVAELSRGHSPGSAEAKINEMARLELEALINSPIEEETEDES
jgi:hypothetical protein